MPTKTEATFQLDYIVYSGWTRTVDVYAVQHSDGSFGIVRADNDKAIGWDDESLKQAVNDARSHMIEQAQHISPTGKWHYSKEARAMYLSGAPDPMI